MIGFYIVIILILLYFIITKEGMHDKKNYKKIIKFNEEDYYSSILDIKAGDIIYDDIFYSIAVEYNNKFDNYLNKCSGCNNIDNYGYNKIFDNCLNYYNIEPKNKIILLFGTDGKYLYLFPINKLFLYNKKIKKRNFELDENEKQRLIISINKFYETNYIKSGELLIQELLMDANIIPFFINTNEDVLLYSDNSFKTKKRNDKFNYLIYYMNSYVYK
jgi:hypothetical protein